MDAQLLLKAKRDIPLYFKDFKAFWDSTTSEYDEKELTNCYAVTLIFKNWLLSLNNIGIKNLDGILKEIHEDINASFFHSYFGHYRSAHMHLRSVIELSLQLIYFYQHEIEYFQWRNGDFRIKHEDLTNYLKKHPNLKTETANNLITEITSNWKMFSKHIHAETPNYFQSNMESVKSKQISKRDFGIWKSNFNTTGYVINKLFLIFFRDKLHLFPTNPKELLLRNMKKKDLKELGYTD
ncbi:hypothetical protein ACFQZI_18235 [Mucilaginibacter lutimaris]|uniref:Uncharacterized protein n=1 Tax=Mucilaginibacter lutimaris TaxID=931629 RepID=A0ABW2ZKX1_9SPHI